jgi:hypothetical protein
MLKSLRKLIAAGLAVLLFAPALALANPLPYINAPLDTVQATVNAAIANLNSVSPQYQYTVACTGTTTATCQGTRLAVSITGLTTADAGAVSAAMTVTDASVVASSQINCFVNGYAGTGVPYDAVIIPAAGSFSFVIQNNSASAALNATVVSICYIYN